MTFNLFVSSRESISVGAGDDQYQDLAAVMSFVESLGMQPVRLATDDWLTLRDIAARIGTSRSLCGCGRPVSAGRVASRHR